MNNEQRQAWAERKKMVLEMYDTSLSKGMLVMSMASDAQESIRFGQPELAIQIMNDIKIIVSERLAQKDEHGRML